jgi:hypothetical protein
MRDRFPPGVADKIGWYVYRLIDPRNGETFYVGKGKGDRVFSHARGGANSSDEDALDLKLSRIREILAGGFEVTHVIHHHGIADSETAYRIEAAIMDCYPGLTNRVSGHGASEFGVRHVEQIIADYAAPEFVPQDRILAISIGQSHAERSIYEAVRGVWKLDLERARAQDLVLAVVGRMVRGVFRPREWVPATVANFPLLQEDIPGRIGFVGKPAEPQVAMNYMNKVVPEAFRHGQNPVRFIPPKTP